MQIPLFPLHTVLAPGIALPLHIFEERYRVMVRHCLDTSTPFGIVLIRQGTEVAPREGVQELSISSVGTFAEIREASKYLDGRWDLLTVGTGRFVVREVIADVDHLRPARRARPQAREGGQLVEANGNSASGRRQQDKVRVAIVGVGNCANSFVQGLQHYKEAPDDEFVPGLMHVNL